MKIFKIILVVLLVIIIACGVIYFFADGIMANIYIKLGDNDLSDGDIEQALSNYSKALEREPTNVDICLTAAEWYAQIENYTRAEQLLYDCIELVPEDYRLYSKLSAVYVRQDKLLDAVSLFDVITNETAKAEIEALRPTAPEFSVQSGNYNEYFSVVITVPEDCYCFYAFGDEYPSVTKQNYVEPIEVGDGSTTITAIAIDMDGNVSELSTVTYNVSGVIQTIDFAEPVFANVIRSTLNKSADEDVISDEAATITSLTITSEDGVISSLDDLRWLPNLTELNIEGQPGLDWSQLSQLASLETLSLLNCEISTLDLDVICELKTIRSLNLSGNQIASVDAFTSMPVLEYLDISMNSISSIDALGGMAALNTLIIRENAVESVSALYNLPNLTYFDGQDNIISDLSPLELSTKLEYLNLTRCPVSDISTLSNCTSLRTLILDFCSVSDISALADCTALENLSMESNSVSDISPITSLTSLQTLNLTSNALSSLPDMSSMSSLSEVYMSYNSIDSVQAFVGMPSLTILNLDYNSITSVAALSGCPMLTSLYCFGNDVTDTGSLSYVTIYG